ncbi:MAG: sugar transferase [Lachnospiraceae bacterium]|nr:sugar transferase [Lachnospiraceae bacterium]
MKEATKRSKVKGKYVYRGICSILLTAGCLFLFYSRWYPFVQADNTTGRLTGTGNLLMSGGINLLLTVLLLRGLGGYRIGVDRLMSVIGSQLVSFFVVNFMEIFASMAVMGMFRVIWSLIPHYLLLFVLDSLFGILFSMLAGALYRKLFPPLKIVEFYSEGTEVMMDKMNARPDKYEVKRLVRCDVPERVIRREISEYDAVLMHDIPSHYKNHILKICFEMDKRVYFTPKISDIITKFSTQLNLFDTPLYLCRNQGIPLWRRIIKRSFDIILSLIAIVLLSPIMLITALLIKLQDGGPVMYKQERTTLGGQRFMIWKFRSMIVDAEADGKPHPATDHDSRITPVGRFIRATRIDELPQLINILKGDMSIVGPRPERVEHVEMYTKDIPEFVFREKIRGGLTGYAQVFGKYNTSALDKLKMDLTYIMNYSLLLDVQIILETVKILFMKESTEGFKPAGDKKDNKNTKKN